MIYIVYKTTNLINGKCYIGQHRCEIEKTYNLRDFCEKNKFPLSYVKQCVRINGKYKDFQIERKLK